MFTVIMTRTDFNSFVNRYARRLYEYAFRFLHNREEAEDAVQEVFFRLWKKVDKLDEYESIEAMATAMTRNYCIDQLRRSEKKTRVKNNEPVYYSTYLSPYEYVEKTDSHNLIHSIIEKLPEPYRQIIKLREIEGLSYREISLKENKKISNLRVIISRARNIIKIEYEKYQYEQKEIGRPSR